MPKETESVSVSQEEATITDLDVYFECENNNPDFEPNGINTIRLLLTTEEEAKWEINTYPWEISSGEDRLYELNRKQTYRGQIVVNTEQGVDIGLFCICSVKDIRGNVLLSSKSMAYSDSESSRTFSSDFFEFVPENVTGLQVYLLCEA